MNIFKRLSILSLFLYGCLAAQEVAPNIILIMADDLGFSDLGCYGGEISTPHIDSLARKGMSFSKFYNTGRCCPTRASLMTGTYPHRAGVGHMLGTSKNGLYYGELSFQTKTIAEYLKKVGYTTYLSGKWHLARWNTEDPHEDLKNWPKQRGFDYFYGTIASIRSYYNPPSLAQDNELLPAPKGDFYYTEMINKNAVEYIQKHSDETPFFLYIPHVAPHWPLHAREKTIQKYQRMYENGWDQLAKERLQKLKKFNWFSQALSLPKPHKDSHTWSQIKPEFRSWYARRMATFAAMVECMDDGVGQILDVLESRNFSKNTMIIFLSDNGGCAEEIGPEGRAKGFPLKTRELKKIRLGNHPDVFPGPEDTYASYGLEWAQLSNTPYRNFKSFVHEGGIHTPAIFYWPETIEPSRNQSLAHVIDILPTCLDLAELKPSGVDGLSLVPAILEQKEILRPSMYWEHEGNCAIRAGSFKLVKRFKGPWELYNLDKDPLEKVDLSLNQPEKLRQLIAAYQMWAGENGVKTWEGNQTPIGGMTKKWIKVKD